MRWKRVLLAASLATLALGVARYARAEEEGSEAQEADETGYVSFEKVRARGEVKPDKALVYFVRPTSMGAAIKSFAMCDDEIVGINRGSSFFFVHLDPGKHVIWAKSENVDAMEVDLEAGKTYYIGNFPMMGMFRAGVRLELLDEKEGAKALEKCKKFGTLTKAGREKGAEIVANYKENTTKDLERRAKEDAKKKQKEEKKEKV